MTTYAEWLNRCEPKLFWPREHVAQMRAGLAYHPVLSLIFHVDTNDREWLKPSTDSLQSQEYGAFEVIVVGERSRLGLVGEMTGPKLRTILVPSTTDDLASRWNQGIASATGDYVAFLQTGDKLHPHALLELVRALNDHPDTDMLYSDEDRVDSAGIRTRPLFKPDFDVDMLLSCNYVGQLMCVRTNTLTAIGGFRTRQDGVEFWDLTLRMYEHAGHSRIRHVAKPLYHARLRDDAVPPLYRPNADSQREFRVLQDYITRHGIRATIEPGVNKSTWRTRYHSNGTSAALIIRPLDGAYQVPQLAPFAIASGSSIYECVGNMLRPLSLDGSAGPTGAVSSIAEISENVLIFVNHPLETLNHDFVRELIAQAMRPECGVVTGLALNADRSIAQWGYLAGRGEMVDVFQNQTFPSPSYMGQLDLPHAAAGINDFYFAVHKNVVADAGGFGALDSHNMSRFLRKLLEHSSAAGLRLVVTPYAIATIASGARAGAKLSPAFCKGPHLKLNPNLCDYVSPAAVHQEYA